MHTLQLRVLEVYLLESFSPFDRIFLRYHYNKNLDSHGIFCIEDKLKAEKNWSWMPLNLQYFSQNWFNGWCFGTTHHLFESLKGLLVIEFLLNVFELTSKLETILYARAVSKHKQQLCSSVNVPWDYSPSENMIPLFPHARLWRALSMPKFTYWSQHANFSPVQRV